MANPHPRTEYLRKWQPGQSGNPAGSSRKQRLRLTARLEEMFDEKEGLDKALIKAGVKAALDGDFNFWKYIFERIDGKLPDRLAIEGEAGEVLTRILRIPPGRRKRESEPDADAAIEAARDRDRADGQGGRNGVPPIEGPPGG